MATQTGGLRKRRQNRGCAVSVGAALVAGVLMFTGLALPRFAPEVSLPLLNQPATPTPPPLLSPADLGMWKGEERVNIALLGIDTRADRGSEPAQQLVAVVLITLDPASQSGGVLTLPPELYLPQPGRESGTLSTAYTNGGAARVCQALEFNLGFPVRRYIVVGAGALSAVVDLIGGVEVYTEAPIVSTNSTEAEVGIGWNTLNGTSALAYLRQSASTFDAMQRQHKVLFAGLDRLRTTDAAEKLLPRTAQILQTLSSGLQTNLTPPEVVQIALLARAIPQARFARLMMDEQAVQPWTTPTARPVLVPIRDRLRLLRESLYHQPATTEAATAAETDVRVRIENGTQRRGLAAGTRDYLQAQGFIVESIGDAAQPHSRSLIVDYRGRPQATRRLAEVLGLPLSSVQLVPNPDTGVEVLIVLGEDYQPSW